MTSQQPLRQMSTREWERAITTADLVAGPAFAYHLAGGGPAAAVHVATGDSLTDETRQQLITELQKAIDATVTRVLSAQIIRTTTRDEEAASTDAPLSATLATLADRYDDMARHHASLLDFFVATSLMQARTAERARLLSAAAASLRDVLRTGRIPHSLMTDAELNELGPEGGTR